MATRHGAGADDHGLYRGLPFGAARGVADLVVLHLETVPPAAGGPRRGGRGRGRARGLFRHLGARGFPPPPAGPPPHRRNRRAATARPGADSRAAPCGASGRAAGGAAVVLERSGVATRLAVGPPARAHRRDEPDASPRRRSCRPSFAVARWTSRRRRRPSPYWKRSASCAATARRGRPVSCGRFEVEPAAAHPVRSPPLGDGGVVPPAGRVPRRRRLAGAVAPLRRHPKGAAVGSHRR